VLLDSETLSILGILFRGLGWDSMSIKRSGASGGH
jgi:hypothetical protein